MNIYFINPPFKAEYGKFSRESRSPAITKSGALYYPLWLIYAALYSRKQGHIRHPRLLVLLPGIRGCGYQHRSGR